MHKIIPRHRASHSRALLLLGLTNLARRPSRRSPELAGARAAHDAEAHKDLLDEVRALIAEFEHPVHGSLGRNARPRRSERVGLALPEGLAA